METTVEMSGSVDDDSPITVAPGEVQSDVDPTVIRPSRLDLVRSRLDNQLQLLHTGVERRTPILVNSEGTIVDGHHAVRAAAEVGCTVTVHVVSVPATPVADSILTLSIREQ